MNCCDDYGNCNQGRDCPARCGIEDECYELSQLETTMMYIIIAAGLAIWAAFTVLAVDFLLGMLS